MHGKIGSLIALILLGDISSPVAAQQSKPTYLAIEAVIQRPATSMTFGYGALWTMSNGKMIKIAGANNDVSEIPIPGSENALQIMDLDRYRRIAVGEGGVWLPDMASSSIFKIDPEQNKIVLTIVTEMFGGTGSIGVGEGSVWVITFDTHDKTLTRYDARSGALEAKVGLPRASRGVLVAFGSVWVTAATRGELYRIDPTTNQLAATIQTHGATHLLAADQEGSIWLAFDADGIVQRINASTGMVVATIKTDTTDTVYDGDIAIGDDFIWMINRNSIVSRINPETDAAEGTFRAPIGTSNGRRLSYGANSLWLSGDAIYRIEPP
jgi:virginiamycin B lyase